MARISFFCWCCVICGQYITKWLFSSPWFAVKSVFFQVRQVWILFFQERIAKLRAICNVRKLAASRCIELHYHRSRRVHSREGLGVQTARQIVGFVWAWWTSGKLRWSIGRSHQSSSFLTLMMGSCLADVLRASQSGNRGQARTCLIRLSIAHCSFEFSILGNPAGFRINSCAGTVAILADLKASLSQ